MSSVENTDKTSSPQKFPEKILSNNDVEYRGNQGKLAKYCLE